MMKASIATPQVIMLALMMFTWGLSIQVKNKSALNAIKALWLFSAVILCTLTLNN